MSFTIHWDPAALFVFYRLRVAAATAVDRAILRWAQTGEGDLEWVAPYHRLRAGRYEVALSINRVRRTVDVIRIYGAR
jgi:hypothetical protein